LLTRKGKRLPSDRLSDLLGDQGLMECARWSECEPIVRELARELPDFDSVWLDAMVQRQLLTPWQASQLQLERPGRLVVGGRQLREPLGSTTFLAFAPGARSLEIMKSVAGSGERMTALLETVKRSGAKHPRSIVLPALAEPDDDSNTIWLSSAWILGWDFSELLVRGGRLPWQAVAEVGRELLQALAWFESGGTNCAGGSVFAAIESATSDSGSAAVAPSLRRHRPGVVRQRASRGCSQRDPCCRLSAVATSDSPRTRGMC
jgi:hypothetical protein